jgi:DNA adenine methylase
VLERTDFEHLADQLAGIAGRLILTINAADGAREVFARFDVVEAETTYTIATAATGGGKRVKELVVQG